MNGVLLDTHVWIWSFAARGNAAASLALSKYYEHWRRDPRRAMRYASQCPAQERQVRERRLQGKLQPGQQLALWPS